MAMPMQKSFHASWKVSDSSSTNSEKVAPQIRCPAGKDNNFTSQTGRGEQIQQKLLQALHREHRFQQNVIGRWILESQEFEEERKCKMFDSTLHANNQF